MSFCIFSYKEESRIFIDIVNLALRAIVKKHWA